MTRTRRHPITKLWRRHGKCNYCLEGRLHTQRGRLEWFLFDLHEYFRAPERVLAILVDRPEQEFAFDVLVGLTGLRPNRLNRSLRTLVDRGLIVGRIQPGTYPNAVRYQLSNAVRRRPPSG